MFNFNRYYKWNCDIHYNYNYNALDIYLTLEINNRISKKINTLTKIIRGITKKRFKNTRNQVLILFMLLLEMQ